jgi:hypothetical protein
VEPKNILGMACGYYLSRFDLRAYDRLGFGSQQATHEALGRALDVPPKSIKNWRDEFDPVHENARQGWHKREMAPSRRRMLEALGDLSEAEIFALIKEAIAAPSGGSARALVQAMDEGDGDTDEGAYGLRGPTGIKAEQAFQKFHHETGQPVPGELRNRTHDQCGFDFEIVADEASFAVEVKGLAGENGGVSFTDCEWRRAREMGDAYYLAIVRNVATTPQVSLIRNPAAVLTARMRAYTTVQVGWSISHGALLGVRVNSTG